MGFPPNWTRDEAILALDLYRRVGLLGQENPEIQETSLLLKELTPLFEQGDPPMFRNPSGVAMKLANFARLDPEAPAGLKAGSQVDEEVWNEFSENTEGLSRAAAEVRKLVPQRSYWTWVANPKIFRVDDAIRERDVDRWLTKGKDVKKGDRGIVWRSKGSDGKRGVIAIGEVISDPREGPIEDPYWLETPEGPEEYVEVRYVPLEGLPLWSGHPALDALALNADRARGGTIFHLDVDQWLQVVQIARDQRASAREVENMGESGSNFYVIRAGKGGARSKEFERLGVVTIGFDPVGGLSGLERSGVKTAVNDALSGESAGRIGVLSWELDLFANKIKTGDLVVTPEGASGPLLFGGGR